MKIGLLGGSFDPVHIAHIALARAALSQLELDQVQLIPAGQPWQRGQLNATGSERIAMLNIAIRNEERLHINPLEIERGGKTYTIDTLRDLPAGPDYIWILGADQLDNFCTWHEWRAIASLVHIAVAQRPGSAAEAPAPLKSLLDELERPLLHLDFEPMPISASTIRQYLASGQSVQGLLDPAVARYIEERQLYRRPSPK